VTRGADERTDSSSATAATLPSGGYPDWQQLPRAMTWCRSRRPSPPTPRSPGTHDEQRLRLSATDDRARSKPLHKQGSHVDVITPDADSRAALGMNQMDLATRIPAARASFAQGKQEATRVTFL
jgi:hypothetical protein